MSKLNKDISNKELFRMAVDAEKNAYAPFSNFHVGRLAFCRRQSFYGSER